MVGGGNTEFGKIKTNIQSLLRHQYVSVLNFLYLSNLGIIQFENTSICMLYSDYALLCYSIHHLSTNRLLVSKVCSKYTDNCAPVLIIVRLTHAVQTFVLYFRRVHITKSTVPLPLLPISLREPLRGRLLRERKL